MRLRRRRPQREEVVDYRARYAQVVLRHSATLMMARRLAHTHDNSNTSSVARRLAQVLVEVDEEMMRP